VENTAVIFGVEEGGLLRVRRRQGLQELLDLGVTRAARMPPLGVQEVDDQVASDRREPAAERAPGRIWIIPLDRGGDGPEDLLNQVGGILDIILCSSV